MNSELAAAIRTLTGVDLRRAARYLLKEGFAPGQGFFSQYPHTATVSCTTTAICSYSLAEMGFLTPKQRTEFQRLLLAFRVKGDSDQQGAFPRTTGGAPVVWTTAQAVLALISLGAPWNVIKPSVNWLLRTQASNGGWNFPGVRGGFERLIYTFYPVLVLVRRRRELGTEAEQALARVATFVDSCEERGTAFWQPLREHIRRLVTTAHKQTSGAESALSAYGELFHDSWPGIRVDEDWLTDRFSLSLMCGPNYLHIRRLVRADHPIALLHVRHLADERINAGWSDRHEASPKTWATALAALTLHRWANDILQIRPMLKRLPTRAELLLALRSEARPTTAQSTHARELLRRMSEISSGPTEASKYQCFVRDAFIFLFGDLLKEPKLESKTMLGTLRRDITFRNAASAGPWLDWKSAHENHGILVECKNKENLSYHDLRQTACYLGKRMGRLAILACRRTTADDVREMLNWFVNNDEKYLLVVDDQTLADWIRLKDRGEDPSDAIGDLYRTLREGVQ
jgi:hypothetical protein